MSGDEGHFPRYDAPGAQEVHCSVANLHLSCCAPERDAALLPEVGLPKKCISLEYCLSLAYLELAPHSSAREQLQKQSKANLAACRSADQIQMEPAMGQVGH